MDPDTSTPERAGAATPRKVLVGRSVTIRQADPEPCYFTELHRRWIGKVGRVHAIVPSTSKDNPLVKVGFDGGTQIVFFRLAELDVHSDVAPENPRKHGHRGSHLPTKTHEARTTVE